MDSIRPRFHVIAPTGWMNDPCAPCYNPKTKTYHLFYQWNPKSAQWGDISWGHVESDDLLRWRTRHKEPVVTPGDSYDQGGVFTGCMHVDPAGNMTIIYTSARDLPIHWTKEHKRGSESVSLIRSSDGGITWHRHASNPIIPHEPSHLTITGFRDPYVSHWPEMDELLDVGRAMYALVSGGTPEGPNTFLYRVDEADLTRWEFIGPLVDLPRHHCVARSLEESPSEAAKLGHATWRAQDLGCNFECTTFVTLTASDGSKVNVLLPSSEGVTGPKRYDDYHNSHPGAPERTPRGANWLFGDLSLVGAMPRFTPTTAGLLDHGSLYACTIFPHPDGRTIMWGWIIEDDVTPAYLDKKGWTGCLGVPREIFLCPLGEVSTGLHTAVKHMPSVAEIDGRWYTLGVRPISELEELRLRTVFQASNPSPGLLVASDNPSHHLDIRLSASVTPDSTLTVHLKHNDDLSLRTSLVFKATDETISVDRSASTVMSDVNTMDERGPFTLFRQSDEEFERLELRIMIDGDVVGVFANDRFSISTRTYAPRVGCGGVSIALEGGGKVEEVGIWEMDSIGLA